ncbi:hypothetical protein BKA64DRAFT_672287 [Cadophora sp. MPI-SDFR-AT-0126]|nr:hypothetical protein BKA64DRAFT_672287 [Leotiomycetes sp. MPI-SDFR-AT-0126]
MESAQPGAIADAEGAAQRIKPRRPHHKSRNGCVQCKARKIKCGEEKPTCKKCQSYGTECSFLQTHPLHRVPPPPPPQTAVPAWANPKPIPTGSREPTIQSMLSPDPNTIQTPSPAISSPLRRSSPPPESYTMQDLELLHFYTTTYSDNFFEDPKLIEIYRTTVVQLAFDYPFLMHEIMAVAALNLAILRPQKRASYLHLSDTHAATGLSLFQAEISNLNEHNCHACLAFSSLIFTNAWASQDVNKPSTLFFSPSNDDEAYDQIRWIKLQRGTKALISTTWPSLVNGPMAAVFKPWKDLDPNRPDPLPEDEERRFQELTESWATVSDDKRHILDGALKQTRRVFSMLTFFPERSKLEIIMTWFTKISDEYLDLLEQKYPQAILIVMHYCVVLKRLESIWWMKGKAENLMQTMIDVLGSGWERWTRWPIEKVLNRQVQPY